MKVKNLFITILALIMAFSCFIGCSQEVLNPETFGIEDFIDGHAKYVLGTLKTDVEFQQYASGCLAENFCLPCNLPGAFRYVEGSKTVKWQINRVIMREDWERNEDAFLYPTPNEDNYPVFFIYTLDVDGNKTDYIARATQNPNKDNKWEVEFVMMPTPDQLACVTKTLETNSWHTVNAE